MCANPRFSRFHTKPGRPYLLRIDLPRFNQRSWDYLSWHNRERPHHSLGLRPPLAVMNDAGPPESSMCWRNTAD